MRGRAYAWYRLRLNLVHVPEALRPPQEPLDPDAAPDDWANLSDDERAAWMAGRTPGRRRPARAADRRTSGLSRTARVVRSMRRPLVDGARPGRSPAWSRSSLLAWATADPTPPLLPGRQVPRRRSRPGPRPFSSRSRSGDARGPAIRDEFGENEELARVGQRVTILGEPGGARKRPVGASLRGGGSERLAG